MLGSRGDFGGNRRAPATPGGTAAACCAPANCGQIGKGGPCLQKLDCFSQEKLKIGIFVGKLFICGRFEGYTQLTHRSPFAAPG